MPDGGEGTGLVELIVVGFPPPSRRNHGLEVPTNSYP